MDDALFGFLFFVVFILLAAAIPLSFIALVNTCVATARITKWQKERAQRLAKIASSANSAGVDVEMNRLIEGQETEADAEIEDELDPADSDDEAEIKRREEEERDFQLTTGQKFRKEWKKAWTANPQREALVAKEKEDRKKMAKAVAKEMLKAERRRNRLANGQASSSSAAADTLEEDALPSYNIAVATDAKR